MRQESVGRKIRDEQPPALARRRHQGHRQFSPLRPAQIEGDRQLALVQPLPVQAVAARVVRPAIVVRPTADRVETDDTRAHLGKMERTGGPCDERGPLDNGQVLQKIIHRRLLIAARHARLRQARSAWREFHQSRLLDRMGALAAPIVRRPDRWASNPAPRLRSH